MKTKKYRIFTIVADIALLAISFFIVILALPERIEEKLTGHGQVLIGMTVIWITVSVLNGKLLRGKITNLNTLFFRVIECNFITVILAGLILLVIKNFEYSHTLVLSTALVTTVNELLAGSIYLAYRRADLQNIDEVEALGLIETPSENDLLSGTNGIHYQDTDISGIDSEVIKAFESECGPELAQDVLKLAGDNLTGHTAVLSTTTTFNVAGLPGRNYNYIINLRRINDVKKLDHFLDAVNRKLGTKGYLLCCVETKDQRKSRFLKKFPPVINYIFYTADFFVNRVLPKFRPTRWLYLYMTRGDNGVISRAEALGRLSRAGFRIKKEAIIENLLWIESRKNGEPLPHNDNVYSTLIALPRVGKNGKIIKVYKLRTMHPYSEYIQDYVYSLYDLREGGKFKNDFRITSWGSICRKTWLDEIPMLINMIRGEMKLIGVRPLSKHYFDLYGDEVKERRIRYKPGLIPPFYADLPGSLGEIQASEMKYLNAFDKHPFFTDLRYFLKSMWNILFRHARSR